MSESRIDRVSISKEARAGRTANVSPAWIPPVLKSLYDFTKKMAKAFSGELKEPHSEREEELIKAVVKSFKGQA